MTLFDASFRHADGWPVLSITASPQTMQLTITNRSPVALKNAPRRRTQFTLLFRPGVLDNVGGIALAPECTNAWTLSHTIDERGVELRLVARQAVKLAPGASLAVRLDGVSAAAAGGSRGTRIQLDAIWLVLDDPQRTPATQPCLIHLSVLRRHESSELTLRQVRTGSVAMAGPFVAGIVGGHGVINDGVTRNAMTLRIVNVGDSALPIAVRGDEAVRFTVSYPIGTESVPWGLLGSRFDHVTIELGADSLDTWEVDRHTVWRVDPAPWRRGDHLDLDLVVHTNAPPGRAPIVITFENVPGHDDDDLVVLVDVGPWSVGEDVLRATTAMEIRSGEPRLSFVNTNRVVDETTVDPSLTVDSIGKMTLEAQSGVYLAGSLTVAGTATFLSAVRLDGPATFAGTARFDGASTFAGAASFDTRASFSKGLDVTEELRCDAGLKVGVDANTTLRLSGGSTRAEISSSGPLVLNDRGASVGVGRVPDDGYRLDVEGNAKVGSGLSAGSVFVTDKVGIGRWELWEARFSWGSQLIVELGDGNGSTRRVVLADSRNLS